MLRSLGVLSIAMGLVIGAGSGLKPADPEATTTGRCPAIYAPVICDHGKTYPNQCVADQHHAKNCVPAGL